MKYSPKAGQMFFEMAGDYNCDDNMTALFPNLMGL